MNLRFNGAAVRLVFPILHGGNYTILSCHQEELAFYDAITKPEAVKDFYTNAQLHDMTRELTETMRKSRTIDWYKKDSARAEMRRMVKRLLKKYKYPPEGLEDAIKTVIAQCEMWADEEQ